MYFPIYIIKDFECSTEDEKRIFLDGKTVIRGAFCASDYSISFYPNQKACTIYLELTMKDNSTTYDTLMKIMDDFAKLPDYGDKLNLFMQYRAELFWFRKIEKKHIFEYQRDGIAGVKIILPIEQSMVKRLG
jgi:hypothetical protein